MIHILQKYLNEFVSVYIDDIVIFSETFEKHLQHLEKVLKKLVEA